MQRALPIRVAVVATALSIAAWSAGDYLALERSKAKLVAQLETFGSAERNPGVVRDVSTETDSLRAGLKTARVLLAEELDRRWLAELSPVQQQQALDGADDKLELAQKLALEVLERRPSSWQGLMILGGSRYVLASRRNTPGRWSRRESWERPLLAAIERAPFQAEPKRVLAAAYLSEWSIANDAEREEILDVLTEAFQNLDTLDQLLPAWLAKASSFELALSVIPSDPRAWRQLDDHYRRREDWRRLARVLEHWDRSLPAYLEAELEAAGELVEGDEGSAARRVLLAAITEAPVRSAYSAFFEQAITLLPPGPVSDRQAGRLRRWLDWGLDQCVIDTCPFERAAAQRLSRLARETTASRQAVAALIAGDLAGGEAIEERSMRVPTEDWIPYLLLKSTLLKARGESERSGRVLSGLPSSARYAALVEHVRRRTGFVRRERAPESGWLGDSTRMRKEWLAEAMPDRLEVIFENVGASGATLEAQINGTLAGFYGIETGAALRLMPPQDSELVVLELERLAGGSFRPLLSN